MYGYNLPANLPCDSYYQRSNALTCTTRIKLSDVLLSIRHHHKHNRRKSRHTYTSDMRFYGGIPSTMMTTFESKVAIKEGMYVAAVCACMLVDAMHHVSYIVRNIYLTWSCKCRQPVLQKVSAVFCRQEQHILRSRQHRSGLRLPVVSHGLIVAMIKSIGNCISRMQSIHSAIKGNWSHVHGFIHS